MTIYPDIILVKNASKYDRFEVAEDCALGGILIPKGFVTDFASVPQMVWWLIPPHGKASMPSIVHDFMYQTPSAHLLTRRQVDDIWFVLMKKSGVPTWQRYVMYLFVRALGLGVWKKYRKKIQ